MARTELTTAPSPPAQPPEQLAAPLHPRDVVLNAYRDYHRELVRLNPNRGLPPAPKANPGFWDTVLKRDDPENRYRWNATLECGCVTECLTRGKEHPPTEGTTHMLALTPDAGGRASKCAFVVDAGTRSYDLDAWVDQPCEYVTARGQSYAAIPDDAIRQIVQKYLPGSRVIFVREEAKRRLSITPAKQEDRMIDPVAVAVALRGTKVALTSREEEIVRELAAAGLEIVPPGAAETNRVRLETTYPGILWCSAHDDEAPLREIVRWVKSEQTVSKKGNQYLSWKVVLSCGHIDSHVLSDPDWQPEQGHRRDPEMTEKARRTLARYPDAKSIREHFAWHMTNSTAEWTEPQTHSDCWDCKCHKRIVSYEPVGPLTWKGDTVLTTEQAQQRRLQAVERRADELRELLARAEAEEAQLRGEVFAK